MAEVVVGPTSLTAINLNTTSTGETRVVFTFSQILTQFSVLSNDDTHPVMRLENTARGGGATLGPGSHGLLTGLQFEQHDTALSITFTGSQPIHLEAQPAPGGKSLAIVITPAKPATVEAAGPAGPLPAHVDAKTGEDEFLIVPLKYADISEVVGLLSNGAAIKPNDNFTPQEPAFGSAGIGGNGYGQTNNSLVPPPSLLNQTASDTALGQRVDDVIGVDRRLNAIVLHGPPDLVARLKARIDAIDVPVQSVVLETVFVELTKTGARNLGFDFNNSNGQIAVGTFQRGTYLAGQTGNGIDVAGYGSFSVQAAIYAQVQKGEGRIVSRPRISAQSGGTAKIITGDAIPILTSIALSGVNAVSQQVQYVTVGVTLQIAPRVTTDGYVTSHIFAEVSSETGTSQGYPTISQREASTSATVKDGDFFVIGGLTQDSHLVTKQRVPIAGDIPVVGELFKLHQESSSKTDLYIVVMPHIVGPEDAAIAKQDAAK
ncbi:MAG: type II secretion system protein GspD [Caulobacteraceae bacterium]|nr:type II secretion system protein GspD [Caulobacteraceae bacterium]